MIRIALIAMMCATLAQHLGLTQAISGVASKIADCPRCCSFWSSFLILVLMGCNIFIAVGLSLFMAYLSHWFGLMLFVLNRLYDKIWQRIQRRRKR